MDRPGHPIGGGYHEQCLRPTDWARWGITFTHPTERLKRSSLNQPNDEGANLILDSAESKTMVEWGYCCFKCERLVDLYEALWEKRGAYYHARCAPRRSRR